MRSPYLQAVLPTANKRTKAAGVWKLNVHAAGPRPASATAPRNHTETPVSRMPDAAAAMANTTASSQGALGSRVAATPDRAVAFGMMVARSLMPPLPLQPVSAGSEHDAGRPSR